MDLGDPSLCVSAKDDTRTSHNAGLKQFEGFVLLTISLDSFAFLTTSKTISASVGTTLAGGIQVRSFCSEGFVRHVCHGDATDAHGVLEHVYLIGVVLFPSLLEGFN